jgi:hypothetical protein
MLRIIQIVGVLVATLLLNACATKTEIETSYSKATKFEDFKYYRWHKSAGIPIKDDSADAEQIDAIIDDNIRFMVEKQLASKGLTRRDEGVVDFLVNYHLTAKEQADVDTHKVYDGYSQSFSTYNGIGYAGQYYGGVVMTMNAVPVEEQEVTRYRKGTMILDFVEPDTNKLIWRASAQKELSDEQLSSADRDKLIDKTINKILAKFPPK